MRSDISNNEMILSIEELTASYYKKDILSGVNLNIKAGEVVTLLGTNGSGKSTLLKTIMGLIKANSGKIKFDGIDITGKQPNEIFTLGICYQIQGNVIFKSLSVVEHIKLAMTKNVKPNIEDKLQLVWTTFPQLSNMRNKRTGLLSGGERQMLALSMLLVQDNKKLWLLDEPSGGLAPQALSKIIDTIEKINKEQNISILLVEQNLKEGLRIADRAYVLKDGKAFQEENPLEILSNGKLEEIFFE